MSTTLITNGIVVDAGTMRPLDILISGERVESLLPRGSEVRADRVIDASGRYVLPGIIDAHNHPVYADRIDRLSRAALSGGVTTVIPYMGPSPHGANRAGWFRPSTTSSGKGKPVPASTSGCTAP